MNVKAKVAVVILSIVFFTSGVFGLQASRPPSSSGGDRSQPPVVQGASSAQSLRPQTTSITSKVDSPDPSRTNLDASGSTSKFGGVYSWFVVLACTTLVVSFLYALYKLLGRLLEKDTKDDNDREETKKRAKLILWTIIGLVWAFSCFIFVHACKMTVVEGPVDIGNVVTVLFGASSIALFIFSLFVALLAIIGWQSIRDHISKSVTDEIKKATQSLENELRGRVATVLGYAIGEMSLNADFDIDNKGRLEQAVSQCREGYKYLQNADGPVKFLGLNNFIFYFCVLHGQTDKADEVRMLKEARLLRDAGEEHNSAMLKLTAARVFLEYGATAEEKEQALATLGMIAGPASRASEREKTEALCYLKKYDKRTKRG